MDWDEFSDLVAGLSEDTPLIKMAMVRTESRPEALEQFTPGQLKERAEWQRRRALKRPRQETEKAILDLQETFKKMFTTEAENG